MLEKRDICYIINAHQNFARKPSKTTRKWDGMTPYYVHPLWCANTILAETQLPTDTRRIGATSLLYHDVLEDTTVPLPEWLDLKVVQVINDMTFKGGFSQEQGEVWTKGPFIRLLKLYDKVNNLMDGSWMSEEKFEQYRSFTGKLTKDVEHHYGGLNITKLASTL